MAETNKDRIHNQIERIHDLERAVKLKPDITIAEYIEFEKELLEELRKEK